MTTLKTQWKLYRDEVLIASITRMGFPVPPPRIIESFRRTFYCGAAAFFAGIIKREMVTMDMDKTVEELEEFAEEMRSK